MHTPNRFKMLGLSLPLDGAVSPQVYRTDEKATAAQSFFTAGDEAME